MKKFIYLTMFALLFTTNVYAEGTMPPVNQNTGENSQKAEDKIKEMEAKLQDLKDRQAKAKETKIEDIACVKLAMGKKEDAVATAFDVFTASMKTALTTRKTALLTSFDKTVRSERVQARNDAWSAYKTSAKTAHNALKTAKKSAYDTFKSDSKACGSSYKESAPMSGFDQLSL